MALFTFLNCFLVLMSFAIRLVQGFCTTAPAVTSSTASVVMACCKLSIAASFSPAWEHIVNCVQFVINTKRASCTMRPTPFPRRVQADRYKWDARWSKLLLRLYSSLLSGDLGKISSIEETVMLSERCLSSSEMKAWKIQSPTRFFRYHFSAARVALTTVCDELENKICSLCSVNICLSYILSTEEAVFFKGILETLDVKNNSK